MSEDTTKTLSDEVSFEARVLSELGAIRADQSEIRKEIASLGARVTQMDERLTSLEERVDARLRETRPIWEAVQEDIRRLDRKFDQVIKDVYEVRADYNSYEKRLSQFEKRLSQLEDTR